VAALIKDEFGVETELVEGARGEFTVWVGDQKVAQKAEGVFPSDEDAVSAVKRAIEAA
jgi:hypothetical protein